MSKREYEVRVTIRVMSETERWANIKVLAALSKVSHSDLLSFSLGEIAMGEEEQASEEMPKVEYRRVWSDTHPDTSYDITIQDGTPVSCTCPDYVNRQERIGGYCKHMAQYR